MGRLLENASYIWMGLGLIITLLEIIIPGFVAIFFGLGAFLVGVLLLLTHFSFQLQLFLFIIFSLTGLIFFRKYAKGYFKGKVLAAESNRPLDSGDSASLIGESAIVFLDIIPSKSQGKIEIHGTSWNATTEDGSDISAGTKVVVLSRKNLTLIVKKIF